MEHQPPPSFRLHDDGNGISIAGWTIRSVENPIASSAAEEALAAELDIKLPGMLFDQNNLSLSYAPPQVPSHSDILNNIASSSSPNDGAAAAAHFKLQFNALDALRGVGQADPTIQVKAAAKWRKTKERRDVEISTIEHASDWTFSTSYVGTIQPSSPTIRARDADDENNESRTLPISSPSPSPLPSPFPSALPQQPFQPIDYAELRDTTLPILFSAQTILFEDELDDNGTASYRIRMRVMPSFVFLLARFFLRVDGVLIRVYDTRYFHRFGSDVLVREIVHREADVARSLQHLHMSVLKDPEAVTPHVPITLSKLENIVTSTCPSVDT